MAGLLPRHYFGPLFWRAAAMDFRSFMRGKTQCPSATASVAGRGILRFARNDEGLKIFRRNSMKTVTIYTDGGYRCANPKMPPLARRLRGSRSGMAGTRRPLGGLL
jgi:hypothetical protein